MEKISVAAEECGTRRNTRRIKELCLANRFARVIFVRNFQSIFATMSQKERIEMSAWLLVASTLHSSYFPSFPAKRRKNEGSKRQRKKEVDFTDRVRVIFFSG